MHFDFSHIPLRRQAFSRRPMTFCDPEPKNALSAIIDIIAIETGERSACADWQAAQLRNLLGHAAQRSKFWKQRIGGRGADAALSSLPELSRSDVAQQVAAEGSLLAAGDGIGTRLRSSSGSSGVPVKFFVSAMNANYNHIRSIAQFFLEGRDLALNRVQFALRPALRGNGLRVTKNDSWLGSLSPFIRGGTNRLVEYFNPDMTAFRAELQREPIGYLVAAHWGVEAMLREMDTAFLKSAGLAMWIPVGSAVDPEVQKSFAAAGIPVRAVYSAEECGCIGSECEKIPGNYHVATSNVVVEIGGDKSFQWGGKTVGPVLVTHLHSYATPFIRYDVGDVAAMADRCECGHDGPTLSDVLGRSKNLISHADGSVTPLYFTTAEMEAICALKEFRIRQTAIQKIVVEIGGRESLSPGEIEALTGFIGRRAGPGFDVEVHARSQIDWGSSLKRLGFRNELL